MRAYCVHTCHYVAIGTVGTSVAPAGAIVTDMDDKTYGELERLGSVREPTEKDETNFAVAMKKHGSALPGARSGKPAPPPSEPPAGSGSESGKTGDDDDML